MNDPGTRLEVLPEAARELIVDYCTVTVRVGGQAAPVFAVLYLGLLESTLDRPAVIVPGIRREWCHAVGPDLAVLHREGAPAYLSATHSVWYNLGARGTCWQHQLDRGPEFVRPLRRFGDEAATYDVAIFHNIAASGYITYGYPRHLLQRCPRGRALALGDTNSYIVDIPDEAGWRIAESQPEVAATPKVPKTRSLMEMIW